MKSLEERINDTLDSVEAEIERAKIGFTEELLAQMETQGISRTALAQSLGVKPARITALLRGSNNFTLETMVRLCRALGAKYTHYICPRVASVANHAYIDVSTLGTWNYDDLVTYDVLSWAAHAKSNICTFPGSGSVGEEIDSRNRIEVPQIDANLALAA
jgi:transcriptional regulator with XRE-family HTH domain